MGKVNKFTKARFLNKPKLVFSKPKSSKIDPLLPYKLREKIPSLNID